MFGGFIKWMECKKEPDDEVFIPNQNINNIQNQPDLTQQSQGVEEIQNKKNTNEQIITIQPYIDPTNHFKMNKPSQDPNNIEQSNQQQTEQMNLLKQTNKQNSEPNNFLKQTNQTKLEPNNFQNNTIQQQSEPNKLYKQPNQPQQDRNQLNNQTNENKETNKQQQLQMQNQFGKFQQHQKLKILCTQQNQNQFNLNNPFQNNSQQNQVQYEDNNYNPYENNNSIFYSIQQSQSTIGKYQRQLINCQPQNQNEQVNQNNHNLEYIQSNNYDYINKNDDQMLNIFSINETSKSILGIFQLRKMLPKKAYQCFDEESIMQTNYIRCQYCENDINTNYVQLSCDHHYCEECLKESLKNQVRSKATWFQCQCGITIKTQQIWDKSRKDTAAEMLKLKLLENQLEVLRYKLSQYSYYKKCSQCNFFVLERFQSIDKFYCPDCQKFY